MEKLSCIKKKKTKFILSFISGIIYTLTQGLLFGSAGITVYILSYIHHKYKWVDMQYGNLMMPLLNFFLSLFSPLSGPIEKIFGPILPLLISGIFVEICLFLFYIQRNIWLFYIITLLCGFGFGISANIPMKNACMYYPEKKGLIGSIIMSFLGISISIYTIVGEKLINPNKEGVIDNRKEPYYSLEVSERCKNYYLFALICFPIGTIITLLTFYKYDPLCEIGENQINDQISYEDKEINVEEEKEGEAREELKDVMIEKKLTRHNSFHKSSPGKNAKKAMKDFRFWRNIIISGLPPFLVFFLQSSFRAYVVMLGVDTKIIFFLASGLSLTGCLLGPVWASLVDRLGFQPVMKIICSICLVSSIYFFFFFGKKLLYTLGLIFSIPSLVAILSTITPHLMHIYGMSHFLILGGFAKLFYELSDFFAALTSIILSIFFKNAEQLLFPYKMVAVSGGVFSIIGLILTFFENDEKFVFGDENEENEDFSNEGVIKLSENLPGEKDCVN